MKEKLLDVIKWGLIIIIAALAFLFSNRYTIVGADGGVAYKMNKITGQVYSLNVFEEVRTERVEYDSE
jgi:hypothetical protein